MEIKIKKLNENAVIPSYAKPGDMGMDLTAIAMEYDADIDCYIYHTGLAFELPKGYGMLLFPRSSNRKTEAYMTNHVGILDSGYRGELLICYKNRTSSKIINAIKILSCAIKDIVNRYLTKSKPNLSNFINEAPYEVGERIAQLVIIPYPSIEFIESDELSESERGEGGHGSTGK